MKKILSSLLFTGLMALSIPAFAACPCFNVCPNTCCPMPSSFTGYAAPTGMSDYTGPILNSKCHFSNGMPALTAPQAAACPQCRYLLNSCPSCACPCPATCPSACPSSCPCSK